MKRKKGHYSISVVAKMFSVHQQTIRMYEKEGLIAPKRSDGNTRLFSEEDVDRLEEIINLTHKMGVNLAGVEIILKLQKKMKKLQGDMNKLFSQVEGQLEEETEIYKQDTKKQVQRLAVLKKENKDVFQKQKESSIDVQDDYVVSQGDDEPVVTMGDWEVEYEDD